MTRQQPSGPAFGLVSCVDADPVGTVACPDPVFAIIRQPAGEAQAGVTLDLRLMATSDLHAHVLSYDYAGNRPMFGQGLVQTASLIAAARAEQPDAVLLDNGDFFQGSALADMAARRRRSRPHPVIAAFNALGYDAATLGNHEFNFGLPVLQKALAEAQFAVVSANVLTKRGATPLEDQTFVPPFALIDRWLADAIGTRHRIRLGVLGLTPPEIMHWDREHLEGKLDVRPMLESARVWVPHMRQAGADIVVCLAHTGIAIRAGLPSSEGLATDIAAIAGIDAVIAGHSHLVFPQHGAHLDPRVDPTQGLLCAKPTVQPGHSGSHLGVIDLKVRRGADGAWAVGSATVRAISVSEEVAGLPAAVIRRHAAPLRQALGSDHSAALAWTRRPLGRVDLNMSTCFAQVADGGAMQLVAMSMLDHARRALAGTAAAGLPVVATATPYRAGGRGGVLNYTDIRRGELSVRHLFDLCPFPDTLMAVRITGAALIEQMERAAALFAQVLPGRQDQPLIDPAFPGFAFATFHGIHYRIDPSAPARYDPRGTLIRPDARRISAAQVAGRAVRPEDQLVLVTNNYRAGGTLGIRPPAREDLLLDRRDLCTDVLRDFIQRRKRIDRAVCSEICGGGSGGCHSWALRALPGSSVTYDTGATASNHLDEVAHLRPEFIGLTAEGFHRFRLFL